MRGRRVNPLEKSAFLRARASLRARKQRFPRGIAGTSTDSPLPDLPLVTLPVLMVDAQATASRAAGGHLLELGWAVCSAAEVADGTLPPVATRLIALPDDAELPPPVEKLTGITRDDLAVAVDSARVWQQLAKSAQGLSAALKTATAPTVIHFQSFETPFLRWLHRQHGAKIPFPLSIICTHEITRQLLPSLPSKGLRAVAGYFDHNMALQRRSEPHVAATVVIWRHLVEHLASYQGIHNLAQLQRWLAGDSRPVAKSRVYPMKASQRRDIPEAPGVYHMLRANGDLLYVGKAASLRRRVASYFQPGQRHAGKTLEMLTQAKALHTVVTGSALEAALLEVAQIQKRHPPYNMALQPRRYQLCFATGDFSGFCTRPDARHRLGPLLKSAPFEMLHQIGSQIQGRAATDRPFGGFYGACGIELFGNDPPDVHTIEAGLALFQDCYAELIDRLGWRAFSAIGRLLLAVARLERPQGEGPVEGEVVLPADTRWQRSPEGVCRRVASLVRGCARDLCRARWFCLLSESVLAWPRTPEAQERVVLAIERGRVSARETLTKSEVLPPPPGYETGRMARQGCFDGNTYDRMRVLTTEIRRLVAAGRPVELRVSRGRALTSDRLDRVLRYV